MQLDRLVELRTRELLDERDRLRWLVLTLAVNLAESVLISLAVLAHATTSTPIERAVPAMIFIAASTSLALRSASFVSAICRS